MSQAQLTNHSDVVGQKTAKHRWLDGLVKPSLEYVPSFPSVFAGTHICLLYSRGVQFRDLKLDVINCATSYLTGLA